MKRRIIFTVICCLAVVLAVGVWRHYYVGHRPGLGSQQGNIALKWADRHFLFRPRPVVSSTISGSGSRSPGIPVTPSSQSNAGALSISGIASASVVSSQRHVNSLAPNSRPSDTEMVFLAFQLNANEVTLRRQWKVPGNMRLPPLVVPRRGVFHRLMTASGEILAQGIIPDPTLMYYDYIDPDSGRAKGGAVIQTNASFNVRYPWIEGADHVELYKVEAATDLSMITVTGSNYYGSFKITTTMQ